MPSVLIAFATLTLSGCLVIEKKTMVMILPRESNEVQVYYVFEGISSHGALESAQRQLDELKKDDFSFFFFAPGTDKENPLLQHCRFEKLRFFVDAKRERSLCADRRMTILDRKEFAKALNKSIARDLLWVSVTQDEIKKAHEEVKKESSRKMSNDLGVGPFHKTAEGLVQILDSFDAASNKLLQAAVGGEIRTEEGFRWLRFEPEAVRLVLPATLECAKRVVADPKSKNWLKEMRTFVQPIDLQTCDEGLAIVLGTTGKVIRFSYTDTRGHTPVLEADLAKYAGSPKAIILDDGKAANAGRLVERFVAEKTKKR
jgi:hypothetical protein